MIIPRLKEWRQTLGILLAIAAVYVTIDVFFYLVLGLRTSMGRISNESADIHKFVLVFFSLVWGAARLILHSPTMQTGYRRWLAATPWELGKPLPKGTVFLTAADVAGIAVLAMVMRVDAGGEGIWPVYGFAMGYLVFLAATIADQKEYVVIYVMAVLTVPIISIYAYPATAFGLIATVYAVGAVGMRSTLRKFPWPEPPREKRRVGWPFDLIAPNSQRSSVRDRWAVALTLLAGWIAYWIAREVVRNDPYQRPEGLVIGMSIYSSVMVLGRMLAYLNFRKMPVNIWGRIWRGVLWLPRYDVVWLSPLGMMLTALVTAGLTIEKIVPVVGGICAGVTFVTGIALLARPTMEQWDLTGHHYLARTNTFAAQQQKQARRTSRGNIMALRKPSSD